MIVDVHAHYYPEEYIAELARDPEFELNRDDFGNRVFWYQGARVFTVPEPNRAARDRVAEMDAAGVAAQVLSLGTPNVYVRDHDTSRALATMTNDILAGLVAADPGRFRALASLPLASVDDALRELARAVGSLGMDGVQLGTNFRGEYFDAVRFAPLLEEMNRLRLPVLLHPVPRLVVGDGRDYGLCMMLDFTFDTTTTVARLILSGTLDRYPDIQWILSHGGGTLPYLQGRMDFGHRIFPESRKAASPPSAYLGRLFYDTMVSGHEPALACLFDTVAPSQIVFGTDCPHNPAGASLEHLRSRSDLPAADLMGVLGANAIRLFPALASAAAAGRSKGPME